MQLAALPDAQTRLVVVGTSVRKPLAILKPYLDSLDWQERPSNVEFRYVFVPDGLAKDADDYLRAWTAQRGGEVLRGVPSAANDFSDAPGLITHQWSGSAIARVGQNKNKILRRATELRADAIWLSDADLIMDRTTFASLWAVERPIACAVYWTHWNRSGSETRRAVAAPQVWLRHPYLLDGRGMEEWEFRDKLIRRQLTRVWGQGACTLLRTPVVHAGITFEQIQGEPALLQGLMAGEDRHFCIRAERAHVEMWADPWPDIFHIYHQPEDLALAPAMAARLGTAHPERPMLGDLVSLRLDALEPFPQPNGQWARVAPQFVRGRLGALNVLPELEEAILGLRRGQDATVPVHVPVSYPMPYLRGRRRLIRVELIDCKPLQWPPVLERDILVGQRGGSTTDKTVLTEAQHAGVTEVANG